MSLHHAYHAVATYLGSTMSEPRIDQMSDEEFVTHRANALVARNKLDAPFVITPVQWLDKVALVEKLQAENESLYRRTLEAERRAVEALNAREEWKTLYEQSRIRLEAMETDRNIHRTANGLAENEVLTLREKLASAEARVAHLRKLGLDKSPSPG